VTVTENLEQSTLPLTPKVIVKIRYVVTCRWCYVPELMKMF
jgi:hypothetical protein